MYLLRWMGRISLILATSSILRAQDADIAERLYRSGERAYATRAYGEAMDTWNQLLQAAPKSPFAAEALLAMERWNVADAMAWQRHIDGFGLAPHAFKTLYMMSTGMRRKAVLAVVLASGCPLLLLDEPTAGLDAPSTAWLVETLNTMGQRPNQTALVVLGEWPDALDCTTTTVLTGP